MSRELCDQCDGEAQVVAVATICLPSGRRLTFCGHCTDVNREKLLASGAVILDDREVME